MHYFFVSPEQINGDKIEVTGENFHHMIDVLRIGKQEKFEVCDGKGKDYLCQIDEQKPSEKRLTACILDTYPSENELPYRLVLYQGLAKGKKMDEIIQKGTELGISDFVPFESKFCVVHLKEDKTIEKKVERWQKIAKSAAQQSKRGRVPRVHHPIMLSNLDQLHGKSLIAYENERDYSLKAAVQKWDDQVDQINILIGPEGGFDEEEVSILENIGVERISLGKRILRTETAGVVLCAQLNYALE
ncbi:RsmE family RNA methyltransferase [Pseudoramibacter porci]|nr:RsmE family RNA methyltransferase [Pseudoramibacter porci]